MEDNFYENLREEFPDVDFQLCYSLIDVERLKQSLLVDGKKLKMSWNPEIKDFEKNFGYVDSIGIGMPGCVSHDSSLVKNANSVWLNGKPLKRDLEKNLKKKIILENDANYFALSEAVDGAGKGHAVVFGVIIGTGTGGGISINQKVLTGKNNIAGEWGHISLPNRSDDEKKLLVEEKINHLENMIQIFEKTSNSKLVITNFNIPSYSPNGIIETKSKFGFHEMIEEINNSNVKKISAEKKLPDFFPGDIIKIGVRITEGKRDRIQYFEGVCIAKKSRDINSSFTVRKISFGEGVERTFALYSPIVDSIKVIKSGKVRKAKLYYLRDRTGKSARITEKIKKKIGIDLETAPETVSEENLAPATKEKNTETISKVQVKNKTDIQPEPKKESSEEKK